MTTDRRASVPGLDTLLKVSTGTGPSQTGGGGLAPIERPSLFEEIVERLVEFIIQEGLKPGDRLPTERELSERLGVGRSTIREAITALRAIGVVELTQRGMNVGRGNSTVITRPLSWGLLINVRSGREIMDARRVLESGLAAMAAERATEEDIAAIAVEVAAMERASRIDDFVTSDLGFHLAVARAGHNFVLLHVVETLQHVIRTWIEGVAVARSDWSDWVEEHREIYEAIRDGHVQVAHDSMREHLSAAGGRLLDVLGTTGWPAR